MASWDEKFEKSQVVEQQFMLLHRETPPEMIEFHSPEIHSHQTLMDSQQLLCTHSQYLLDNIRTESRSPLMACSHERYMLLFVVNHHIRFFIVSMSKPYIYLACVWAPFGDVKCPPEQFSMTSNSLVYETTIILLSHVCPFISTYRRRLRWAVSM